MRSPFIIVNVEQLTPLKIVPQEELILYALSGWVVRGFQLSERIKEFYPTEKLMPRSLVGMLLTSLESKEYIESVPKNSDGLFDRYYRLSVDGHRAIETIQSFRRSEFFLQQLNPVIGDIEFDPI